MNTAAMAVLEAEVVVGDHQPHAGRGPGRAATAGTRVQNAPSSLSPTAQPEHLAVPGRVTPVATTTARDTTWPPTRPLT